LLIASFVRGFREHRIAYPNHHWCARTIRIFKRSGDTVAIIEARRVF
jgi:hypothetical protein